VKEMQKLVLGVFNDEVGAESALAELEKRGFNPKDLSVIMKDRGDGRFAEHAESKGAHVMGNAAAGAATGGAIGALAGLLVGIGAITLPGVGAILIGGPLAAALGATGAAATTISGAATGAVAGGLIGALTGLGIPEKDARYYEESIRTGGILLAVPVTERDADDAEDILDAHGADQIRSITTNREHIRRDDRELDDMDRKYHYR
jgi:uncharacterized membrane protein